MNDETLRVRYLHVVLGSKAYYPKQDCNYRSISLAKRRIISSGTTIRVQDIKVADWSQEVAPFWGAVIKSALSTQGFSGLFKAGWTTIKVKTCLR